ncbi:low molecular weight protein tyrosine phosphatase family protein [Shimia sp. NS0008-38b]|uniref:phosphotyrosine protein phosphatase n=1 Tax=Shimia sp. NS0008-38b TaxID=3127653 RepID=UPI003104A6E4
MRSPTAAQMAAEWFDVDVDFAGLSRDADEHLTREHLEWADLVVVMERRQSKQMTSLMGALPKSTRLACLSIPDQFQFMQPELIALLRQKLPAILTKASLRS